MTLKERYQGVIAYFQKSMPVAESELDFRSPFELLVAVVLSLLRCKLPVVALAACVTVFLVELIPFA